MSYVIIAVVCFVAYCMGLYVRGKELKEKNHTIDGYFHTIHVGIPPVLSEDASGKKIYRCKKCYKRVYRSLKHCPTCAQRIDWSGVHVDYLNKEKADV